MNIRDMGYEKSPTLNIIYIEDDIAVQTLIRFYLKNWPHHVAYANDGNSAIDILKNATYDLILMDWGLPTPPSGQGLIDSIRGISGYEETPIIVITGYDNPKDLENLNKDTIQGFLNKPITKNDLKKLIDGLE